MTGPMGNSEFCFPRNQSLSVYYRQSPQVKRQVKSEELNSHHIQANFDIRTCVDRAKWSR